MITFDSIPARFSRWHTYLLLFFAAAIVCGGFLVNGDVGFNISDEGFLWDGVRRTINGEIPIRDFNAYDSGRYYWCAGLSHVLGDGLIGLRRATSLFWIIGLFIALVTARRVVRPPALLFFVGVLLWWWHPTYYKTFEVTCAIAAVYSGVLLIEHPTTQRCFLIGIVAGVVAVFGRNLGLYTVATHACIIAYLYFKNVGDTPLPRRIVAWALGIVVGYSPMLLMLALVPGFLSAFTESLAYHIWLGRTNMALPVPWPWRIPSNVHGIDFAVSFAVGIAFLIWSVFATLGLIRSAQLRGERIPSNALFVSSTFAVIFFAHHAFTRADYEHLAHVISPLMLGLVAAMVALWNSQRKSDTSVIGTLKTRPMLSGPRTYMVQDRDIEVQVRSPFDPATAPAVRTVSRPLRMSPSLVRLLMLTTKQSRTRRWRPARVGAAAIACIVIPTTIVATLPYVFPVQFYGRRGPRWEYAKHEVAGASMRLPVWETEAIQMFQGVLDRHLKPGRRFMMAPYEAGFYPVLGQTSPVWNSYFVLPEMEGRQKRIIQELDSNGVDLVLINDDAAVDGNPAYRFRNSHELVWNHLRLHFQSVPDPNLPPGWLVFARGPD